MTMINYTTPELCPLTDWMQTWNQQVSKNPDRNTLLDLRPHDISWTDLFDSLNQCQNCAECIASGKKHEMVSDNVLYPPDNLANRFRSVILHAHQGADLNTEICMGLLASWWCEDMRDVKNSIDFRLKVMHAIQRYHLDGGRICAMPGVDEVLCADLLRRSCRFHDVLPVATSGLSLATDDIVKSALLFQIERISSWDTLRYTYGLEPVQRGYTESTARYPAPGMRS